MSFNTPGGCATTRFNDNVVPGEHATRILFGWHKRAFLMLLRATMLNNVIKILFVSFVRHIELQNILIAPPIVIVIINVVSRYGMHEERYMY